MSGDALDLLDEAVATLRERLAPELSGEARYLALLAANAVATACRETRLGAAAEADPGETARLARAIREGLHDGDAALFDTLLAEAARRAWIADPAELSEAERRRFLGEGAA